MAFLRVNCHSHSTAAWMSASGRSGVEDNSKIKNAAIVLCVRIRQTNSQGSELRSRAHDFRVNGIETFYLRRGRNQKRSDSLVTWSCRHASSQRKSLERRYISIPDQFVDELWHLRAQLNRTPFISVSFSDEFRLSIVLLQWQTQNQTHTHTQPT